MIHIFPAGGIPEMPANLAALFTDTDVFVFTGRYLPVDPGDFTFELMFKCLQVF